ncbi:lengsin-like [Anneissia japonica]|uniref:lengsin-like n=1 Tax=Anneissia japonica TaxID=1529436 RepID=UPI001425AD39|nr:lengsin-like [Anneissia japonica]XP_033123584.1 lengsin-like [Anneissia japonica]
METVLQRIRDAEVEFIRFEVTDMFGNSRMKVINANNFKSKAKTGIEFNSCYLGEDSMFKHKHSSISLDSEYNDLVLIPDLDTFEILPWWDNTARILVEPVLDGMEYTAAPRFIARKQLEELGEMGYSLYSAHEYEFYAFKKDTMEPIVGDINCRSTLRFYKSAEFLHQLGRDLPKVGVDIECLETEHGPGQIEITYKPSFGIKAADNAFTFKNAVKEIAKQHSLIASFMSKPYPNSSGSSCHFNHSLWDADGKVQLTHDSESPDKLSDIAKHWLAGLLHHAPAMSLIMGPTINCRKRFVPRKTVPLFATWGFDNRTAAMRVKTNNGFYVENRLGCSGTNPYLALAATVAAGMDGIKQKLPLSPSVTGCAYTLTDIPENSLILPTTLQEAINAFLEDKVIRSAFGEDFVKAFMSIKNSEIMDAKEAEDTGNLTWEWDTYLEYV